MLRVILEVIPEEGPRSIRRGKVVRVIDIKEDGTGDWQAGNYKSRWSPSLERIKGSESWRKKQVMNMPYKEFMFERLLHSALTTWLRDHDNGDLERNRYQPDGKSRLDRLKPREEDGPQESIP